MNVEVALAHRVTPRLETTMEMNGHQAASSPRTNARVLVVADWTADPATVVAACRRRADHDASFILMVPAWLHGLDWVGDPSASAPCAHLQLVTLKQLCVAEGLAIEVSGVGDPDPITAIGDALVTHPASEILLFARDRWAWAWNPLDLSHRAERISGLPVQRIPVRRSPGRGHCDAGARWAA